MQREDGIRRRPSLSLPILRTSRSQHRAGTLTLGNLLAELGDASFGWAIVIFSIVTLLPLPPGSTLITALPLMMIAGQMVVGYSHVKLPGPVARLRLDPLRLRQAVLRLRPVTRRLERVLRPRYAGVFQRRHERPLGLIMFVIAVALFVPVPFSSWFPAIALFVVGIGLVEKDGLVTMVGLTFGAASVILTAAILTALAAGADAMIH